ncbi:hypothetical protein ABZ471_30375 [Streptomyces sp. NPDC005728]|uniref:hypothetical protein n=1 Tax=Streptomyces sp. NPDC005728 TaxID=3157054 RepID=UPI0033F08969
MRTPVATWTVKSAPRRRDYITLQSRRIKTLTATKIEQAVDGLLAGEWADKTARIHFATSLDSQDTKPDTTIREQTGRLATIKITFVSPEMYRRPPTC